MHPPIVTRLARCASAFTCALGLSAEPGIAQVNAGVTLSDVSAVQRSSVAVADSLYDALDAHGALERLRVRIEIAPDDFEAQWRAGRAALAVGILEDRGNGRVAALELGLEHAEAALAMQPDHPEALGWTAALKGRLAIETGGPAERSRRGGDVWDLAHRLLEIDPDNALGHDILGKLQQEVRKLSSFERFFARTFMSNDAIRESSWEGSEYHLTRAIELDPNVILFYLDLGETYLHQDKDELAIETLEKGLTLPNRFPPDERFKRIIARRLRQLRG